MDEDEKPYRATERDGAHLVTDAEGNAALACGDSTTAERYAAVLNEAWRRGYKAGYRAAKRG